MGTRTSHEIPRSLSSLQQRFVAWRKTRASGQRIPEALWNSAVRMANQYGLNRTARVLGLDYYCLKKRVDRASGPSASTFVALPSSPLPVMSESVIEWEDVAGWRLRVELRGQNTPDLLALSRSFWNAD